LQRYEDRHLASWVYNRMIQTRVGGEIADQAMTSAYLWGAEDLIAYLSRFMRLRTGTVIGLAAPGWDGVSFDLPDVPGSTLDFSVELSEVGSVRTRLRRIQGDEEQVSPLLSSRQGLGLSQQVAPASRSDRSLWVLRGNYRAWDTTEGLSQTKGIVPLLYPIHSLEAGPEPLVLPPHATTLHCAVQMAGVIGPTPVYQATPETALSHIASIVPLISVRDGSLVEAVPGPNTYEARWAYFLGGCGDGFFQMGPGRPVRDVGSLRQQTMRLTAPGLGEVEWQTQHYLRPLVALVALLSRQTTLLPGDVLSLGVAGPELKIPLSSRVTALHASCSWGFPFTVTVDDQRQSTGTA
jgi:2-keto-4-pentenoate hydratase/2-oxohepta-3-ene-1,7-dioic acid hydratase in catechol pathway